MIDVSRKESAVKWFGLAAFTGSLAEATQTIAMVWTAYTLTKSGLLVGSIHAAAYLPAVLAGLFFHKFADRGNASRLLIKNNWGLFVGATTLTAGWFAFKSHYFVIAFIFIAQCTLSIVKLMNKVYLNREIRNSYSPPIASRILSSYTAASMVGSLLGGASAGLLLTMASPPWCAGLAAVFYFVNHQVIKRVLTDPARTCSELSDDPQDQNVPSSSSTIRSTFVTVLIFSIPSSGALPYFSTLLPSLSEALAKNPAGMYSILSIVSTLGGFLAGLSVARFNNAYYIALRFALPLSAASIIPLSLSDNPYLNIPFCLITSFTLTTHIIAMQISANQMSPQATVGKMVVFRNTVAGLSKAIFSLAAGYICDSLGLPKAWIALTCLLSFFTVAWLITPTRFTEHRLK